MNAKGRTGLLGPTERLLEFLRDERAPVADTKQEIAASWVNLKHRVRRALPEIDAAAQNKAISSLRARLRYLPDEASRRAVSTALGEMEAAVQGVELPDEVVA